MAKNPPYCPIKFRVRPRIITERPYQFIHLSSDNGLALFNDLRVLRIPIGKNGVKDRLVESGKCYDLGSPCNFADLWAQIQIAPPKKVSDFQFPLEFKLSLRSFDVRSSL